MKKATLYIIQGFIAAGKSTFSRNLAIETNAIHLNPDEWVTKLYKKEIYMNNYSECFDNTLEILWDKTKDYLNRGYDVIFDMGFWKREDRVYARSIADECDANVIHYYLNVPSKILKERIIKTRSKEWAEIHINNFEKNLSEFEPPFEDEHAIVISNYNE